MISMKEKVGAKPMVVGQDDQHVLNFIASEKVVRLDMIVNQFPWIRWGDLFSALGRFRREGLMTVHQVDSVLEIRINERMWDVVRTTSN
ncbi:MAG: hypothetical protein WD425_12750 [Nitrospirales bacterium]